MTDVRQQTSQSTHTQELSKMRMECANQKEEQRQVFEEEKALLRAELSELIAKTQTERNTFDKERIRKFISRYLRHVTLFFLFLVTSFFSSF